MTDETREPLGDLDAKEFYAEGCDVTSCIIVAAEDSSEQVVDKLSSTIDKTQEPSSPPRPRAVVVTEAQTGWEDVIARFAAKTTTAAIGDLGIKKEASKEAAEIQIWESESAKGDDDADAQGPGTDGVSPQSLLA